MKKSFKFLLTLVMLAAMALPSALRAQGLPAIPADPAVKIGTLPNGMTYYIRHNEYPKGQADFYIAQKVGSIQEEDNQRGLAHFLEHMCFNGTKNFPGNQIIDWLETKGVKFGRNLNAYTSIDETVYNISNVPVASVAVQDSCLLILHDWANELLLEGEEIDKERGVIHEEWRSRNVGSQRIREAILPSIYPTSKYAYRMPIGTMEIVDNFPHQALRDYYEKWYRPDLQGIMVVGDIDVDRVEGKIKEMFGDIPASVNPTPREYFPVPDHQGTLYGIGADPEQQHNLAEIMWISDPLPDEYRNTPMFYQVNFVQDMIQSMLANRFNDILSKPGAPFASAFAFFGGYMMASRTKDAFTVGAVASDGDATAALAAAYREILRAARGGFTESEYTRVKNDYISQWETRYNNRETRENDQLVNAYVRNFLDGDPIPPIDMEYMLAQQLIQAVPLEMINEAMSQLITPDNRVVVAMVPEKEGIQIPTEAGIKAALEAVDAETIEAHKEELRTDPLIPSMPKPGKIKSTKKLAQWDAEEWILSNGVRVIVKPTKLKEDEILFDAYAHNGFSTLDHSFDNDIILSEYTLDNFGLGAYNNADLRKYLSGKMVGLTPSIGADSRSLSGSATPKDLPTLMELIYMAFTAPTYDADEFTALQSQLNSILAHQMGDPQFVFGQRVMESMFKSPRRRVVTLDAVNAASAAKTQELVRAMVANPADYTMIFVGNIDLAKFKPLVEQYIASLPTNPAKAVKKYEMADRDVYATAGSATDVYKTKMQTPTTYVAIFETGQLPYDAREAQIANVAGQILSNRLLKTVREDMGAVYSIGAAAREERQGPVNAVIQTSFPMKPEMRDQVLDFIKGELKNMESNITIEEVNPTKEYLVKEHTAAKEKNSGWLNGIAGWVVNGVDAFNPAVDNVKSITPADVQNFMKKLNSQNNYRVVILEAE